MLGFDGRAARYVWTAAVILLLLVALYRIRTTLFVFIVALLVAYLLTPLVDLLDRALPTSRTRTPALVAAYLILIGLLIFAGVELGSRIVDEASSLQTKLSDLLEQNGGPPQAVGKQPPGWVDTIVNGIGSQIRQHAGDIVSSLPAYLPKAGLKALSIAGNLLWLVIVPILSFFFLKDGRAMWQKLVELIDEGPQRELVEDIARDVNVLLAQYMRALMVLSLFTLTFFSFYLSVTRVPYALLLSAIAGMLEFIPMIGPFTAAAAILLVAGFSGYTHLLWILAFLGIYRLFQDYVLSPRLMSAGMELHPLLVLFGVFAGGEIGGIPGTFLSVPVLALVRILYRRLEKAHRETELARVTR
jgi:predicted PurR-regulated permease PerM